MRPRAELHQLLEALASNIYFQPPSNIRMTFPCIIYKRTADETQWADNQRFSHKIRYEITVIDPKPDGPLWETVMDLPLCKFERHFTADNLNHDVFNLFF